MLAKQLALQRDCVEDHTLLVVFGTGNAVALFLGFFSFRVKWHGPGLVVWLWNRQLVAGAFDMLRCLTCVFVGRGNTGRHDALIILWLPKDFMRRQIVELEHGPSDLSGFLVVSESAWLARTSCQTMVGAEALVHFKRKHRQVQAATVFSKLAVALRVSDKLSAHLAAIKRWQFGVKAACDVKGRSVIGGLILKSRLVVPGNEAGE